MSDAAAPEAQEVHTRPVRLRQAREAAGLHIAALAAALKVPVRKLEALEAGRYEELPDMTFARALASSACRHLKVDPAPVLAQLPVNPAPSLGDTRQAINAPFKPSHDEPSFNPWGWLSRPAVLGAIALLLGALVIAFLPTAEPAPETAVSPAGQIGPVVTVQEPVVVPPQVLVPSPSAADAPPTPVDPTAAPLPTTAAGTAAPAAQAPSSTEPVSVETPRAADAAVSAPASAAALLSIVATEASWAEVVNGTGTVVLQRLLQPGERVEFSAAPPYAVVLGRAESVRVSVRGRPFDTAPLVRNNVARFEVN